MKLLVCTTEYHPYGTGIANVVYKMLFLIISRTSRVNRSSLED